MNLQLVYITIKKRLIPTRMVTIMTNCTMSLFLTVSPFFIFFSFKLNVVKS